MNERGSSFVAMACTVTSSFGRLPTEVSNVSFVQLTCAFLFLQSKKGE
jgi:hypothetical protein